MRSHFSNSSGASRGVRNFRPNRGPSRPRHQGAYIHPSRFVNKATALKEQEVFMPLHKFTDFNINESLKRNIMARGYTTPTPIQDGTIPTILEGKDLIGLANTGTGKTAAFLIPIINRLQAKSQETALIVVPTRELAVQIDEEFRSFARGLQIYAALCVGGTSLYRQISALNRRPQIVIGTPGRLKDLLKRGSLKLNSTKILVLDEVDRMLDMGFIIDIRFLIDYLPKERQSLCFSATVTPQINSLINTILVDPITVSVRTTETSENVEQDIIHASSPEQKIQTLTDLLVKPEFEKVLIFGQTKHGVQRLAENLSKQGLKAEAIHGNKSQPQRQKALQSFKNNQVKILVATDVAARGLDIPNVSHVINFDQPNTYDDYVHRIGRTGRAGKQGHALTFVS